MTEGMAGHRKNFEFLLEDDDALAAQKRLGAACDRLAGRSEDGGLPAVGEGDDPALMVTMVMGHQNGIEGEPPGGQGRVDRGGVPRIDHRRMPSTDQQPDVVVLEGGNERYFEHV